MALTSDQRAKIIIGLREETPEQRAQLMRGAKQIVETPKLASKIAATLRRENHVFAKLPTQNLVEACTVIMNFRN
jgi:hypothetical protein